MNCVKCGIEFEQKIGRGRPRTACASCAPIRLDWMRRPLKPKQSKECVICKVMFLTNRPLQKTCGPACSKERDRRGCMKHWYDVRSVHVDRKHATCANPKCRRQFELGVRRKFCSYECKKVYKDTARTGSSLRRRVKKYGAVYESFSRFEVFERDNWMCGICGKKTLVSKLGTVHKRSPTLDHIIPLSKGGGHTRLNSQCACLVCNIKKGDRV